MLRFKMWKENTATIPSQQIYFALKQTNASFSHQVQKVVKSLKTRHIRWSKEQQKHGGRGEKAVRTFFTSTSWRRPHTPVAQWTWLILRDVVSTWGQMHWTGSRGTRTPSSSSGDGERRWRGGVCRPGWSGAGVRDKQQTGRGLQTVGRH